MGNDIKRLRFSDLTPGMIVGAKSASGHTTRKIYKTIQTDPRYASVWSIVVRWDDRSGDWIEECSMVSNDTTRLNKIWLLENGYWVQYRLEIIL